MNVQTKHNLHLHLHYYSDGLCETLLHYIIIHLILMFNNLLIRYNRLTLLRKHETEID